MHTIKDRILLALLRALTQLKRAGLWLWRGTKEVGLLFGKGYQETLGFWLYKKKFSSQRKMRLLPHTPSSFFDLLSQRSALQVILFASMLLLLVPHSVLYTQDDQVVVGRDSALYRLVGPDEEFQEIEDVTIDISTLAQRDTRSYRQGAVVQDNQEITASGTDEAPDPTSISVGGQAIAKPTIISGTDVVPGQPAVGNIPDPARGEIIEYVVQPGDVIGNIAARYGISVSTILWANDLSSNSYIRPGDTLTILPVDGVLHTVKSGDVVSRIARTYDASVTDIITYNRLQEDGRDITVGETLLIPNGEKPQVRYVATAPVTESSAARTVAAPPPSITAPAGTAYLWPTSVRTITQYFGWRHTGLDIAGPIGTPLYATKAGTVIKSQCGWNGGYGCYVIIDHGGGINSLYAHINGEDSLLVNVGDDVDQGQTIALMGTTGNSTGPHVHFEIRVNGTRTNPFQYVK